MPVSRKETLKQAEGMVTASNLGAKVRELERRVEALEKHVSDILNEDIREPLQGEIVEEKDESN